MKSQVAINGFQLGIDFTKFTINNTTNDTSFVKYMEFTVNDTNDISLIKYTLSNTTSGNIYQQQYSFNNIPSSADFTTVNAIMRNQTILRISLGYFPYMGKDYTASITLYDLSNNAIGNSTFNFSH